MQNFQLLFIRRHKLCSLRCRRKLLSTALLQLSCIQWVWCCLHYTPR